MSQNKVDVGLFDDFLRTQPLGKQRWFVEKFLEFPDLFELFLEVLKMKKMLVEAKTQSEKTKLMGKIIKMEKDILEKLS